jgi:spore coat protein H
MLSVQWSGLQHTTIFLVCVGVGVAVGCNGSSPGQNAGQATGGSANRPPSGVSPARGTGGAAGAPASDGGTMGTSPVQHPAAGKDVSAAGAQAGAAAAGHGAGGTAGAAGAAGQQRSSAGAGGAAAGGGGAAAVVDPAAAIFDLTKLHDVRIEVAAADLDTVKNNRDARIAATAYFDNQTLSMIVTHRKGYTTGSSTKPSLVLDIDDTVKNQKFGGLTKLVFNNALQDPSFLNEHLAYEFVRKAGLPAPRTAHASVTLNGEVLGLYIVEEDINKTYLAQWFGAKNKSGNLYEGGLRDFVVDQTAGGFPSGLDLKGEVDEGRTRDDIIALAMLVESASDADYAAALSVKLDFDSFVTAFAIDMITANWDDYCYGSNNYSLYHNPGDDRFVLLLHGMDFLFSTGATFPTAQPVADVDPFIPLANAMSGSGPGRVAARLRAIPALETRLRAEVGRLIRTVWDVDQLTARIDQVASALHTNTKTDPVLTGDIASFDAQRPVMTKLLSDRKAYLVSLTPP